MEDINALIFSLGSGNEDERNNAAYWLGLSGDKRAIEPLIKALQDKSEKVRASEVRGRSVGKGPVGAQGQRAVSRAGNQDRAEGVARRGRIVAEDTGRRHGMCWQTSSHLANWLNMESMTWMKAS